MTHVATKALLALALSLGSLAAAPAVALADGFYFGLDTGPRPMPGPDRGPYDGRYPPPPREFRDGPREFRDRGCDEREALRKAWRMGLDRPEIVRMTPRRIVVEGEGRRGRIIRVEFANAPGCPVI